MAIKVEEEQCVALLDPMADTVLVSKEFLSNVNHNLVTENAIITLNTTNGSLKNVGFVASINLSSLDDPFHIQVKTLTSASSINRL